MLSLIFFIYLSFCAQLDSSSFYGYWYLNSNSLTDFSSLKIKLFFYQKQSESDQYILKLIHKTANEIITTEITDNILYVLGTIQIDDFYGSISLHNQKIPITGIYKTETNQFFLIHSLQNFLPNKIVNEINYTKQQIIKSSQLITFLSSVETMFKDANINSPKINDQSKNDEFVDKLQSYTKNNNFENYDKNSIFPLIYFELSHTKIAPKTYFDCNIDGYVITNISVDKKSRHFIIFTETKHYNLKYISVNGFQLDKLSFIRGVQISVFISAIFLIMRWLVVFYIKNDKKAIDDISIHYPIIVFFVFYCNNSSFYDNKGIIFDIYKIIHYAIFIDIIYLSYLRYSPLLKSYCYDGINNEAKIMEKRFLIEIILYIFIFNLYFDPYGNEKIYSTFMNISILSFNLIVEYIFFYRNKPIKASIYEILTTFIRFFDVSFHILYYKNLKMLEKKSAGSFVFIFIVIVIGSFLLIHEHIKNGKVLNSAFRSNGKDNDKDNDNDNSSLDDQTSLIDQSNN